MRHGDQDLQGLQGKHFKLQVNVPVHPFQIKQLCIHSSSTSGTSFSNSDFYMVNPIGQISTRTPVLKSTVKKLQTNTSAIYLIKLKPTFSSSSSFNIGTRYVQLQPISQFNFLQWGSEKIYNRHPNTITFQFVFTCGTQVL